MRNRIICIVPIFNAEKYDIDRITNMQISIDEMIIVDDNGDNFLTYIQSKKAKTEVKYIYNNNIGLSRSINSGLELAISDKADWIVILNQDSSVNEDFIGVFRNYIMHNPCDNIAVLAPQHDYDRHRRYKKDGVERIRYADLSGCLFNTKVIQKIGMFDEFFFIDGLDAEWCLRARKNGYKIIRCNEAVIKHQPGVTKSFKLFKKGIFMYGWHPAKRYYYQFLSGIYIHDKYHDIPSDLFMVVKFFKVLLLFKGKKDYLKEIHRAVKDYKLSKYAK